MHFPLVVIRSMHLATRPPGGEGGFMHTVPLFVTMLSFMREIASAGNCQVCHAL